MSYLRPWLSVTLVKRKALRSFSGMPPRNCQRTSGCISVSLLIGRVTRTRSPAASSALRCACRSAYMSVHGDVHLANQRPPLGLLFLDQLSELLGRAGDDLAALAFEAIAHRPVGEHLGERTMQALDNRPWCFRGGEQRRPGSRFEARVGLGDRRQPGPERRALRRAHGEGDELPGFHMLGDGAAALDEHHLHLPRNEVLHRRAAAAVVDRPSFDAGGLLEELVGKPARRGRPRRAVVEAPAALLAERPEAREGAWGG